VENTVTDGKQITTLFSCSDVKSVALRRARAVVRADVSVVRPAFHVYLGRSFVRCCPPVVPCARVCVVATVLMGFCSRMTVWTYGIRYGSGDASHADLTANDENERRLENQKRFTRYWCRPAGRDVRAGVFSGF